MSRDHAIRQSISEFNKTVLESVSNLVPAVKLQIAFYEQYGIPGLMSFCDTLRNAAAMGFLVIVDAKRGDISSTAAAYANALLGRTEALGAVEPVFDADSATVSPFLGRDSLQPFVEACDTYGKGIFVLVKTSNLGSRDLQDQTTGPLEEPLYCTVARMVDLLGLNLVGKSGYSSVGAVVGATFPEEAARLRALMPRAIFLVPGYGTQGGTAESALACFNSGGLGAIVSASRSITYSHDDARMSRARFVELVRSNATRMVEDFNRVLQVQSR
jgi:orotidine-5'-phosphate decarboxylase